MSQSNDVFPEGPVLVEHSDERLAAVEEAKRTGNEFQSIGAKGTDIVARNIVAEAVREWSAEGSSDPSQTLPDYLVELKENVDDEIELNQQKAAEHSEYSAELVRAQQKAEISDAEKLRKDPDYFANLIAKRNQELAEDHTKTSAQFAKEVARREDGVQEEVRKLRPERVGDPNPITVLGQQSKVTDISESEADKALRMKDRIIYGEVSYKQQAEVIGHEVIDSEASARAVTPAPEQVVGKKASKSKD